MHALANLENNTAPQSRVAVDRSRSVNWSNHVHSKHDMVVINNQHRDCRRTKHAQKYLLDRFSPSRIADDRKPMPFAADESRFVEAAAENRLEPAEPDKRFWKRSADGCCDSVPPSSDSSWNRLRLLARLRGSGGSSSLDLDTDDALRWNFRRLEGTGSKENRATGSMMRASGRVSCALTMISLPSADATRSKH